MGSVAAALLAAAARAPGVAAGTGPVTLALYRLERVGCGCPGHVLPRDVAHAAWDRYRLDLVVFRTGGVEPIP